MRRLDWVVTFYLIRRHRWTDLDAGIAQDTAFAATWFYYSRHDCNRKERKWNNLFAVAVLSLVLSVRIKKQNRFELDTSTINGCVLLGFVALRDPSRLITTSELSIISMLCPDKMLPSRSGTGAASTTAPEWETSILLLQEQICSVTTT